ncbi:unnamed protein product [Acanthoscelides obtectus]|uniref:H15 domain-containing protein n=1 Tax=Acanthoscelides obtectus TaxID=200917 RepID=A0A9P0JXJ6_ACAOB|nr:unnamed protein product [Acanthoscelides obtectus]CAK1638146.1 hypothetical protein AOBTE_LOCUS10412 [Acanthoscelides obtectus]
MSSNSVTRLRRRVAKVVLATLKKIGGTKGLSFKKIYESIRDEYPNTPRDLVNINNTLQKAIAFGAVAQKKNKKYVLGSVVKELMDKKGSRTPYYVIEGPKRVLRKRKMPAARGKSKSKK